MKASIDQCHHNLSIANGILARLNDSHLAFEPQPGTKTAGWLIGHLAVTGDFARRLCGAKPRCPREWRTLFNPGSKPSNNAADYPAIETLRETFQSVYTDLCAIAPNADPELLSIPNPFEPARHEFATAADFVAYLMSSHLAYHIGQLAGWCAAAGIGIASLTITSSPKE